MLGVCQRPKRAFFISTHRIYGDVEVKTFVCQRPKRAFFISTGGRVTYESKSGCVNALNGLSLFLQLLILIILPKNPKCVNALNGLSLFLRNG